MSLGPFASALPSSLPPLPLPAPLAAADEGGAELVGCAADAGGAALVLPDRFAGMSCSIAAAALASSGPACAHQGEACLQHNGAVPPLTLRQLLLAVDH